MEAFDKERLLEDVKNAIISVALYLKKYLPLANAHMTDFIVCDLWEKLLPDRIKTELLALDHQDLILLPSGKTYPESETPVQSKPQLQDIDEDFSSVRFESDKAKPLWDTSLELDWAGVSLKEFVVGCRQRTLPNLNVLSPLDSFTSKEEEKGRVWTLMKEKKFHEVEIMTDLCGSLMRSNSLDTFVDLGSGKGYLGSHLALRHNLRVLGIDCSETNTTGAATRTEKLQAKWQLLSSQTQSTSMVNNCPTSNSEEGPTVSDCDKTGRFVPITQFINGQTNLSALVDKFLAPEETTDTMDTDTDSVPNKSHCEIGSSHTKDTESGAGFVLGGLHACGNLSANTLRLFLSNPEAHVLCQVGCCYNHLTEAFLSCRYNSDVASDEDGFPLSDFMSRRRCQLGRNARMLASQAPERAAELGKSGSQALFWRALLQVILRDQTGKLQTDWQVGKIAAKCTDFKDYVHRSFKKLGISENLTDTQIEDYQTQYKPYEDRILRFLQLKCALAPCVEGIVLLDRLLYLLEQDCVREAQLIQAFDRVKSPRCYVLLGWKHTAVQQGTIS